jgi:ABC-type antimicrobial peptide transport system permease subunit
MRYIISSLWYDRSINAAVMFGVLCTAAVLTGALLVGDSMRGSLRDLTLQRLGNVDTILFAPNFISSRLTAVSAGTEPVIYIQGAAEFNGNVSQTQILTKQILAKQIVAQPPFSPGTSGAGVSANKALADKLQLKQGDELSLRFLSPQAVPPESTFGSKDNLIRTKIVIEQIIPNEGIGRFSLKNDQQAEPLLLVPLDWIQNKLNAGEKVNAVFYNEPVSIKPNFTLDDLGISFSTGTSGAGIITSKRMLFTDEQADILAAAFGTDYKKRCGTGLLYLATKIKATKNGREVPYSTVYATNLLEPSMKRNEVDGLKNDEIAINQWTADELNIKTGDEIELTWFTPDNVNETKQQKFTLTKIVPNDTFTNDVVPDVKGFTDEKSIADWNPPFPFDAKKIRKVDENYWDKYRAAPKAFVDLETGQQLWGSRFGKVSTFIINGGDLSPQNILQSVAGGYSAFNLNFVPVKELGLQASQGTTPFSVLFLCFSFFIIASALMLAAMLFRLSIEMKTKNIGILLAVGWTPKQVLRLCLAEGFVIAVIGSFFGVIFGILYAWLMIYGLNVWWVGAITVPFITLHITAGSLLIGFTSSIILAFASMLMTVRKLVELPVLQLLKGMNDEKLKINNRSNKNNYSLFIIHSLFQFALSNAKRNRTRSRLCIGLTASTAFLVLTVSVFRIDNPEHYTDGIDYIAETAFPVYHDITTAEGRAELGIQPKDEELFNDIKIYPLRMKDGDSTSCLNLYQTGSPRILGVPSGYWKHLSPVAAKRESNGSVPVVLDQNTAQYSLHLYKGNGETFEIPQSSEGINSPKVRCEVAGLLSNSFLQGEILMSEENLLKTFPEVSGWKYYLISCSDSKQRTTINKHLSTLLGDYGVQIESTTDRLRKLFAIQNTYISTFQSLGGIGLLLGTFGLAVIQIRNVFERRKELALFQAIGFKQSKIILLLLYENLTLLFKGLFIAVIGSLFVLYFSYTYCIVSQELYVVSYPLSVLKLAGGMIFIGIVSNIAAAVSVLKIPVAKELAEER